MGSFQALQKHLISHLHPCPLPAPPATDGRRPGLDGQGREVCGRPGRRQHIQGRRGGSCRGRRHSAPAGGDPRQVELGQQRRASRRARS
eukprot:9405418-Pyramimonas_sp.AAC.1